MRHHNKNRKFGRKRDGRKALLRSLSISLLKYGHIETTEAKARELRPYIEKIITKAKENSLSNQRLIRSKLGSGSDGIMKKLFEDLAPKYTDRPGGYVRIVKKGKRTGADGADIAIIEFV